MPTATAKLDFVQIESQLWKVIEDKYPPNTSGMGWPMLVSVYDTHAIAKIRVGSEYGLHRVDYEIVDDAVQLKGDPKAVEQKYVYKGTMEMVASSFSDGDDAKQLLNDLLEKNPLFSSIQDTPNTHLVVFDLTSVGRPSNHAGKIKFQLAKSGLEAALPTLISKPIHITSKFDGHFEVGKDPKPIGAFLGAVGLEQPDGSVVVRAVGTLWNEDFPDEIAKIKADKKKLGASYELKYNALNASRISDTVIEINEWKFSGGAILRKDAAAHPETAVLVANQLTQPRGPEAADPEKEASAMPMSTKFPGVPVEAEAAVEALIEKAVAARASESAQAAKVKELETVAAAASKELETLKADSVKASTESAEKVAELEAKIAEITTQVTEAKSALEAMEKKAKDAETKYTEAQAKLDEIDLSTKVETEWASYVKDHGFTEEQKAEKLPILRKIVAGQAVSADETKKLLAGAGVPKPNVVPLMAGHGGAPANGFNAMTEEQIKQNYPAVAIRAQR